MTVRQSCVWLAGIVLVATGLSMLANAGDSEKAAQIARGKYLVEDVGKCADCHTPFDEKGQPIAAKHLQGAVLMFKPTVPMPAWADRSPSIAGLKGWDDDDAVHFMMSGETQDKQRPRPPMPEYRFNQEDARAVVAYLRSLSPSK